MPGTIHVSVMGFVDLPSSLTSSSISIKVSMGKREYQTSENGDFSFPLASLREKLIIAFYDTEGNQISHTGIETISVVEKGLWVNHFPLEGGGHVHLKLQFILSEEDRRRIRTMREAALRKKHSELLNNSPQSLDTASSISSTAASSFSNNLEVSAQSTGETDTKVSVVQDLVTVRTDSQSTTGIKEDTHVSAQISMVSNSVDLSIDPQSTAGIEEETHVAAQGSRVSSLGSLSTDPQSSTGIEEETHTATQVSMVANPVILSTGPLSFTGIQEDTHVARQVNIVSNPVFLSRDHQSTTRMQEETDVATQVSMELKPVSLSTNPQSAARIREETHVATQLSLVSNPVSLCTAPQSTTEIDEEIHVAAQLRNASIPSSNMDLQSITGIQDETHVVTKDSIVSNPIIVCEDPRSTTREEQIHVAREEQRNSDDKDRSDAPSSTAIAAQAIEVNRTEVSSQEPIEVNETKVSSQGSIEVIETLSPSIGETLSRSIDKTLSPSIDETLSSSIDETLPPSIEETLSPSIDEPINPKNVLSQIKTSEMAVKVKQKSFSFLPKQEEDQAQDKEKQGPLMKTPSSVRKMISAFESTRVQDKRHDSKPAKIKASPSKFAMGAQSKGQESKDVKAELTNTKPIQAIDASKSTQPIQQLEELNTEQIHFNDPLSSFKDGGSSIVQSEVANKVDEELYDLLRETTADQDKPLDCEPTKIQTSSGQVVTDAPLKDQELNESSSDHSSYVGANSSFKDGSLGMVQSEVCNNVDTETPNHVRVSIDEEPTSSGQMYTSCSGSGDSGACLAMIDRTQVIYKKDTFINDLQRVSNDTLASFACDEDERDHCKSSSMWIFPDEAREICVTTGCMDESTTTYRGRKNFFVHENSAHDGNTSCTPRDLDLDNSAKNEDCRGPFGQAIKIAIIVGFGTLVLFSRKSKKR